MAYYDALVAKWPTLTPGTTAQKLAQLNALTVATGAPARCILTPSQIINACLPADLATLTTAQVTLLTLLLAGSQVDASQGTTVRAGVQAIFAGKAQTLAQLGALVAPFDTPIVPWWQGTLAQNGGALNGPVGLSDIAAAGGLT